MNPNFWKNKRVLVTGHTGFKGSWLTIWLQQCHAKVIGFSKDIPTKPSLFQTAKVKKNLVSIMGDIRDYPKLKKTISNYHPEIVIHMAAQSLVHKSFLDPIETYSTNVMGTVNLLESVRSSSVRVLINVTSDKCYQTEGFSRPFTEKDPMGGKDPYSNSKGCSELVTSSFRNSFFNKIGPKGVAVASTRSGNSLGGGDWGNDRLIPDLMRGTLEGKIINIRNPNSIRPWQHVLDPLNGYLMLCEKLCENKSSYVGPWNFGPGKEKRTVLWIVKKVKKLWDSDFQWGFVKGKTFPEEKSLMLDCSKANKKLGWQPKLDLDNALEWTVNWYKNFQQKKDMRRITENQIENFCKL